MQGEGERVKGEMRTLRITRRRWIALTAALTGGIAVGCGRSTPPPAPAGGISLAPPPAQGKPDMGSMPALTAGTLTVTSAPGNALLSALRMWRP